MEKIQLICTFPCIILLSFFGIYFTVKGKCFQLFGLKRLFSKNKSKESLKAFATALGGTVGIGSISGIGYAISTGGAGSIFWMWVSSFFAMGIKYAETFVAIKYKSRKNGGAMVTLRKLGYGKLGVLFAVITLFASLGGGNSAQSGAMAEAFFDIGVSPIAVAVVSVVLLFSVLFGGKERIVKVNSYLVPISTFLYILGTVYILCIVHEKIPYAFSMIIKDAFGVKQMSAGASAYFFSVALRVGVVRGVFSHEAGMGSSPIAHATASGADEENQSLWAVAEIYVDTFLVGTLTALCLICADTYSVSKLFLRFFGSMGGIMFALFMAVFAFSAVLSWCFYSEACLRFLFADSSRSFNVYKIVATVTFSLGCVAPISFSMGMSDILNCLMTYPNLFLLFIKRKEIRYGKREKSRVLLGDEGNGSFKRASKLTFGVKG